MKALIVAGIVALLAAGGLAAAYGWPLATGENIEAPDLTFREDFPKGFDGQTISLRAVSFDGRSRCFGMFNLMAKWTHDGIAYTGPGTAGKILRANPLNPDYEVAGAPTRARTVNSTEFSEFTAELGLCQFEYFAHVNETRVYVRNKAPVALVDADGSPFTYASTRVFLGGKGDGSQGSRFMLIGTASDPANLSIDYRLFAPGSYEPANQFAGAVAAPLMFDDETFVTVFNVPPVSLPEAELVLIPVHEGTEGPRSPEGRVAFRNLVRLESDDIGVKVDLSDESGPRIGHGRTASEAARGTGISSETTTDLLPDVAAHLEAVSNGAILIEKAVEPMSRAGSGVLVQTIQIREMRTVTTVELIEPGYTARSAVVYEVRTVQARTFLVVRFSHDVETQAASNVARVSRVVAAVTQMGADGLVAAKALATGGSAHEALVAAGRALDARGQGKVLQAGLTGSLDARNALRLAQRFFVGAGMLEAAGEWLAARDAPDAWTQLAHRVRSIEIVTDTLLSFTPQGVILVAAKSLALYALGRVGELPPVQVVVDFGQVLLLGNVQEKDAKAAIFHVEPELREFATANGAPVLPTAQTESTPTWGWTAIAALLVAIAPVHQRQRRPDPTDNLAGKAEAGEHQRLRERHGRQPRQDLQ